MRLFAFLGIPLFGMVASSAYAALGDACYPANYPIVERRTWKQGSECPVGFSGQDVGTIQDRCWKDGEFKHDDPKFDHLYSGVGVGYGVTRYTWALDCGYAPEAWRKMFSSYNVDGVWYPLEREKYPTYATNDKAMGYPIWKPEVSAPGFPARTSCVKPKEVIWLTNCDAGCYDRSMQVLFSDGYKTVEDAIESQTTQVVTLTTDSTFEAIEKQNMPITYFTRDRVEWDQKIFKLSMASGGVIKVTGNHPLLLSDGTFTTAEQLAVGQQLVQDSGSFDAITDIGVTTDNTRTFNIAPNSREPLENIVIAEGYLNGSQRYQDKTMKDLNRLVVRLNVPDELL